MLSVVAVGGSIGWFVVLLRTGGPDLVLSVFFGLLAPSDPLWPVFFSQALTPLYLLAAGIQISVWPKGKAVIVLAGFGAVALLTMYLVLSKGSAMLSFVAPMFGVAFALQGTAFLYEHYRDPAST